MSIRITLPSQNRPLSVRAQRHMKKVVEEEVQRSGTIMSKSGQTLALAVDYAEAHNICYSITAMPGMGYFFEIKRGPDGQPVLSERFLGVPRPAGG